MVRYIRRLFLIFLRLNLSQDYGELSQNIKNYPQLLPDISQIGPGKKTFVMGGHEILEIFEHAEDFFLFLAATKTIQFWAKNMQNILGVLSRLGQEHQEIMQISCLGLVLSQVLELCHDCGYSNTNSHAGLYLSLDLSRFLEERSCVHFMCAVIEQPLSRVCRTRSSSTATWTLSDSSPPRQEPR